MKKELLLASLLASNVVAQMTVLDTQALANGIPVAAIANKGVYESNKFMHNGVEAFLRVTLLYAGKKGVDYRYDGRGSLDAQLAFEIIDAKTYDAIDHASISDPSYFLKRTGETSYKMFNCDSTANCYDDRSEALTITKNADDVKVLEFSVEGEYPYILSVFRDLGITEEVAKAAKLTVLNQFSI